MTVAPSTQRFSCRRKNYYHHTMRIIASSLGPIVQMPCSLPPYFFLSFSYGYSVPYEWLPVHCSSFGSLWNFPQFFFSTINFPRLKNRNIILFRISAFRDSVEMFVFTHQRPRCLIPKTDFYLFEGTCLEKVSGSRNLHGRPDWKVDRKRQIEESK